MRVYIYVYLTCDQCERAQAGGHLARPRFRAESRGSLRGRISARRLPRLIVWLGIESVRFPDCRD